MTHILCCAVARACGRASLDMHIAQLVNIISRIILHNRMFDNSLQNSSFLPGSESDRNLPNQLNWRQGNLDVDIVEAILLGL